MTKIFPRRIPILPLSLAGAICTCSIAAPNDLEVVENNRFVVSGGTVLDTQTNLRWQRCSFGSTWIAGKKCTGSIKKFSFPEARKMTDTVVGLDVWRVPTKIELESIIDKSQPDFSIDRRIFPDVDENSFFYWTIDMHDTSSPWAADFKRGIVNYTFGDYSIMENKWSVRLVRLDQE